MNLSLFLSDPMVVLELFAVISTLLLIIRLSVVQPLGRAQSLEHATTTNSQQSTFQRTKFSHPIPASQSSHRRRFAQFRMSLFTVGCLISLPKRSLAQQYLQIW